MGSVAAGGWGGVCGSRREVWGLWQQEGSVGSVAAGGWGGGPTSQQMKKHREGIMVLIWLPHFF